MVYIAKLDFDDFYDLGDGWKTSFKLPNGANFEFWNCNLRYIDANEFHYLEIIANERKNIEECLLILSFCTTIPLIALNYEIINTAYSGNINNRQQDKMIEWMEKVYEDLSTLKIKLAVHNVPPPTPKPLNPLGLTFDFKTPKPIKSNFEDKRFKH